jgi:hypothetical protein
MRESRIIALSLIADAACTSAIIEVVGGSSNSIVERSCPKGEARGLEGGRLEVAIWMGRTYGRSYCK